MLWTLAAHEPDKAALARAIIRRAPVSGLCSTTLSLCSEEAFADPERWKQIFPGGARDAIWFVSEISDASMKLAFAGRPAGSMSEVIMTRFDQNSELKGFVRQVMFFDLRHPFQGLARMQRTARVMFGCGKPMDPSFVSLAALNLAYTAIVFVWLLDRSDGHARTRRLTRCAMRAIALS